MIAYLIIFVLAMVIVGMILFFRRPTITPGGEPTNEEAKIANAIEQKRLAIVKEVTPSGADVRRMTNDELEKLINDRSSPK